MDSENSEQQGGLSEDLPQGALVAGRYEIVKQLGAGGMGSVYLARDRILGAEEVALKILHRQFAYDTKYTQRFLREVQLMRRVNHSNVIRTYDVGADGDIVYFSMEYIRGTSLVSVIENASLSLEQLLDLTIQICEGLEAIHSAGIIHRDLKPENVMYLQDGSLKIADFGVARPENSHLTEHNEVIGSASYMAPEIWLGEEVTPKVDLYSLGMILYELFTGVIPFEGDKPALVMRMHLDRRPEAPNKHNPEIPRWLNRLILRLLEKSAKHRPSSAREIIEYIKNSKERLEKARENGQSSSQAFLERLEASTKKRTNESASSIQRRDTGTLKSLVAFSVPSSRSRFIHRLTKRRRTPANSSARNTGAVLLKAVSMLALTVACAGALSFIFAYWGGITASPDITNGTDLKARWPTLVDRDSATAVLWALLGPSLFLLSLLAIPGAALGSLGRSFRHTFRAWRHFVYFYSTVGAISLVYHLRPLFERWEFDGNSLVSAFAVVGQQLFDIATFSPTISTYSSTVLSTTMVFELNEPKTIFQSFFLCAAYLAHLGLIVAVARGALGKLAKRAEWVYLMLPLAIGGMTLGALFSEKFQATIAAYSLEVINFGTYTVTLPHPIPGLWLATLALVFFLVCLVIPLLGGVKGPDDL